MRLPRPQAQASERTFHTPLPNSKPFSPKRRKHPRTAVGAPALIVELAQARLQRGIVLQATADGALREGVIALARNPEQATKRGQGERRLLRVDECESHSLSFAKKAAAYSTGQRNTTTSDSDLKELVKHGDAEAWIVGGREE